MILVFDQERNFSKEDAKRSFAGLREACEGAGMGFINKDPPVFHAPSNEWRQQNVDLGVAIPAWIQGCGKELVAKTKSGPKMIIVYLSQKPCIECESSI
jgi:hypothetical protein